MQEDELFSIGVSLLIICLYPAEDIGVSIYQSTKLGIPLFNLITSHYDLQQ